MNFDANFLSLSPGIVVKHYTLNTVLARYWRRHGRACMRRLLSTLLLLALVAESLAPIAVWAAPPASRSKPILDSGAIAQPDSIASLLSPALDIGPSSGAGTPTRDTRKLPAGIANLEEAVARRSAHGATFIHDERTFTSVLSAEPLHYRDGDGVWQPIDPAFRGLDDSFTVEHNSIQSRAGRHKAWLSVVSGETAILWESQSLSAVDGNGDAVLLVEALAEAKHTARRENEGRRLRYTAAWSDPTLREELHSAPDSLEQVLVLEEPPRLPQESMSLVEGGPSWKLEASREMMRDNGEWCTILYFHNEIWS